VADVETRAAVESLEAAVELATARAEGSGGSAWGSTGVKTMAFAGAVTLVPGTVYNVVVLFNGTATTLAFISAATVAAANAGLTASILRWAINGTGATKLPNAFTPSSNSNTSARSYWCALS
jgi:hypothetical protein